MPSPSISSGFFMGESKYTGQVGEIKIVDIELSEIFFYSSDIQGKSGVGEITARVRPARKITPVFVRPVQLNLPGCLR